MNSDSKLCPDRLVACEVKLPEILQTAGIGDGRADLLRQCARADGPLHQCLNLFSIDSRGNLFDRKDESRHMSGAESGPDGTPEPAVQIGIKLKPWAHDDKEKDRLIAVDAVPAPTDTQGSLDDIAEGPRFGDGIYLRRPKAYALRVKNTVTKLSAGSFQERRLITFYHGLDSPL